ncbi:Dopey, N-terminal-domain-containing protein [Thamnidium elegans]|nr:Dopey, N-terminal-domain-containing protein [Thamnidium elegans]
MGDNDNLLSISQKLLKKISSRNLSSDTHSESGSETMESPEISSPQLLRESAFQHDSRFRKYVLLVEKNLQSFDAVNEWADIISFLGRLLKSFQAYPQFPVIPRKQLVAKRLAQCLNPGFPAGVHQKTLEVYAFILKTIGSDQLAEDLALWSTGLFPFVQYAATHVKPQLINLFETYYFPLRGRLRPAMRGFIIALLPALEEEGSEYFDKVVNLLENLSETIELPFFYSCMWLVMISNPSLRSPALNYLLRKLPKISDREAVAVVIGGKENLSLMIRAFASTLSDQQVLVQRSILELLVQNFMLKSRMIPNDDLVILMRAALGIVLRKDMSLNRRLYAWLLGTETSSQSQLTYFLTFAEKPSTRAMRGMLQEQQTEPAIQQRPYKILISLMDKWEIGQPIVNNIFIDSLTSLRTKSNPELMQTANMWMDMMEPYLICLKLFDIIDTCFPDSNTKKPDTERNLSSMKLVEFTFQSFTLTDEEIKLVHFPLILAALSKKLKLALKSPSFIEILPQVSQCISLILILLQQLPESVFIDRSSSTEENSSKSKKKFTADTDVLDYARDFYGLSHSHALPGLDELEEEEENLDNVEGGDLSSSSHIKKNQPSSLPQRGPEFEPLRGQVFVKEVADNLTDFLIDFTNSYIVLPENLGHGVDVGVEGKRLKHIEHHLERVLLSACTAITTIANHADRTLVLDRKEQLTSVLLKCCQQVNVFGVVDAGLSTLTLLVKRKRFVQPSVLKNTTQIKSILDRLWGFLSPSMQLLHMRTVELIWLLTESSQPYQIETIVSNYLIHQEDDTERLNSYEKFGIVWELSENIPQASVVFSRPMFLMLDLLREGNSPLDRRAGETWIRCHLKSYVRLLEPFMMAMLDKHIMRSATTYKVDWKQQTFLKKLEKITEIPYFVYLRPFDTGVIEYMFTTLITLITFGGLNVLKTCKHHVVDPDGSVSKVAQAALGLDMTKSISFLDLLVSTSIRFLETEPTEKLSKSLTKPVLSIQLHASDLLYLIISKLDYVNMKLVKQIQTSVIHKLLFCISTKNLDLQQKLLHLLHASLAITCASTQSEKGHQKNSSVDSISSFTSLNEAIQLIQTSTDLFVKCVTDALTLSSNRSMLQHWVDFVLATLPYVKNGFRFILVPILICICNQINARCDTIDIMIHETPAHASSSNNADKELLVLLSGLEKLVMFCLTERAITDDWFTTMKPDEIAIPCIPENSALIGLAQIIYGEDQKPRDAIVYHLPVILHILMNVWHVFRAPEWDQTTRESMGDAKVDAILNSFAHATNQTKGKLATIFEKLFKFSTVDFVEGLTEIFFMENPTALEFEQQDQYQLIPMEILANTPTSTPQHIISTLLDSIRQRTPNTYQNRRRKILRVGKLTDTSILRFAEIYCGYIKNPESIVLLWPIIHSFSKDYLSQANTYKMFLPGLMRFLTIALETLTKSNGYEHDRRIRKDAQELYQRCIDYCILIAGKSFDQSLWMRSRTTLYDENGTNDDASSIHTVDSSAENSSNNPSLNNLNGDAMSRNVSISNVSDMEKKASWKSREESMIQQVNQYLASQVIPRLRQLVGDNDKINSLLNNLVYYVIGPSLKSKSKNPIILDQLCEMASMPFTYRTWRKEIWEVFTDNRFFYMTPSTGKKWIKVIGTAFSIEKERMTELIARVMTSPSNTFFSNKDQESLNRSLNLRRLSFVLFAGTVDQYVPQLPVIQEKIVELLKLDHGEMVHTEIYLCLRVILMRFSQKHLMNFWPVLITELMRIFNSFVYNDFQDRPEEAQIALAGCKFLDLLCTLELDAFQIYQWIFIRDTVETLIKPQVEGPIPIMELLDKKLSNSPMDTAFDFSLIESSMQPSLGSLKRPMLTMRAISSIRQLAFFVEHVGLYVYQSSFTLSKPDLPFIESLLQNDLLKEEDGTTVIE